MDTPRHIPVLAREVVAALAPRPGQVYVDATAGLGGHAAIIAPLLAPGGTVVLGDVDEKNLAFAARRVEQAAGRGVRVIAVRENFASLPSWLEKQGISANLVLADLGFSSNQVEDAARGFSFSREGPLDMRLDARTPLTAGEIVNSWPVAELTRIFRDLGEEPAAGAIARKIIRAREVEPITTTARLADIMRSAIGPRAGSVDPATRAFQALRIAVNDELGVLDGFLWFINRAAESRGKEPAGTSWLAGQARVAIITFHSLEDRPVKRAFASLVRGGFARGVLPRGDVALPSEDEIARNPRARSAKLRAVEVAHAVV